MIHDLWTLLLDMSSQVFEVKSSCKHASDFERLRSYGLIKLKLKIRIIEKKDKGKVFPLQARLWPRGWVEI